MCRLSIAVVLVCVVGHSARAADGHKANLLRNGSFEQTDQNGRMLPWAKDSGASNSTVRQAEGGRFGERCLAMNMGNGNPFFYVQQSLPIRPTKGDRFVFSAYLRSNEPISVTLVLESYFPSLKKESTARKTFQVGRQWNRYSTDVVIDLDGISRSRALVQIHKPGITVFVDGVQVEEKPAGGPSEFDDRPFPPPVDDPFFPIDKIAFPIDDFDYSKYPAQITGYTGQNMQRIAFVQWQQAERRRVGERGNYKAGFTRLPDGRLVLAACRRSPDYGEGPETTYFGMHVYESADEGRSWKQINQTPLVGKEPSLAALADGTLVLTAQNLDQRPNANPGKMNAYRSEDGGRTWHAVHIDDGDSRYPYPRNIFVDTDGSLLYLRDAGMDMTLCRSVNSGKSWTFTRGNLNWALKDMHASGVFAEIGIIRKKSDGRLLAVIRREIPGYSGEGFEDTFLSESADNGKSWSSPWRASKTAEVHGYLTELADGRLLMTYSNYHHPYGVAAIVSTDGGKTWDRDNPIQLALSADCYTGWPVTLQLPDHSLLTSYAVTIYVKEKDKPQCVCEVVRWRLP